MQIDRHYVYDMSSEHPWKIGYAQALGLAYGLSGTFFVQIYGQLYLCELLALFAVLWIGPTRILRCDPAGWWVMLAYGLLLLGLIASDVLTGNSLDFALRGWASVCFATVDVLFLLYLFRVDIRAVLYVLIGAAFARFFMSDASSIAAGFNVNGNAFKVFVVPILSPLLLVLMYRLQRLVRMEVSMLVFGVVFMVFGARSAGLIFVLTSGFLLMRRIPSRGGQRFTAIVFMLIALYLGYIFYVEAVLASGNAGNAYDQLARAENPYNPISLLAQGRSEFRVAFLAITENWFWGRGSWAQDVTGAFSIYQADITGADKVHYNSYIASHSVVLTGWLWGGILGFLGMVVLIFSVLRQGIVAISLPTVWQGLIAYQITYFMWHMMFSPFGHIRTSFPLVIALLFVIADDNRRARAGSAFDCIN